MQVIQYSPDRRDAWDAFVRCAKNRLFMFERDYMDYHAARFEDHSLLFYEEERLVALLPANRVQDVLYSHGGLTFGGFVTGRSMGQVLMLKCFAVLRQYMGELGIVRLHYKAIPHIYHTLPAEEDTYALFMNGGTIDKVEPTTTIDLCLAPRFSKGRKAQVVRARSRGILVEESHNFSGFMKLLSLVLQERHGTVPVHSIEEMRLLCARFPLNIRLFIARRGAEMLAGSIVYIYDDVVHTQYMVANLQGKKDGALDAVIAHLMHLFTPHCRYFDFGISTEQAGRLLNQGLVQQKESFGGNTVCHSTWIVEPERTPA